MRFKKPFRAVPIKVGAHYQRTLASQAVPIRPDPPQRSVAAVATRQPIPVQSHRSGAATQPIPIQSGRAYRRKAARKRGASAGMILAGAALIGAAVGIGSTTTARERAETAATALKPLAVSAGLMRARAPQDGDHWSRCDDARAAGTTPIHAGEPGYRNGLDRDGDGVACEPYRGI